MKNFIKEFSAFALKGNVVNLAVGIIIGAAFQGLVSSLTNDILSPIIGLFMRENFNALQLSVFGVTIKYGAFLTNLLNFFFMALVIFILVKLINKASEQIIPPKEEPEPRKCPYCFSNIDNKATRCPHCTSELTADSTVKSD
jgi:large conductance mechanosensitive channel